MAIVAGSRYEQQPVYRVPIGGGEYRVAVYPQGYYPSRFTFITHEVQSGERLDEIANRYFNDPLMWWVIAVVNPEVEYPENVPAGTVLRIPDA